jgi:acyl carrier protein
MNEYEVQQRVNELMARGFELKPEQLVSTSRLKEDLGLDSLDAVDMLVYLEETIGTRIEGERLMHVKTLGDVYLLVGEAIALSAQKNQMQAGELTT